MTNNSSIEIRISKTKMILTATGAAIFVTIGIWFFMKAPTTGGALSSPGLVKAVGLAATAFFGFILVWTLRRVLDDKPAIIITDHSITDNSSGVSAGEVLWSDVQEIKTAKVFNQKFLMLIVKNPQHYIDRQTKSMKKKAMELNYKNYGSPFSISANSLQYNFDELKALLEAKLKR